MPPVGFEPTILAGERPQTHAIDRAATGIELRPRCIPEKLGVNKKKVKIKNDIPIRKKELT